MPAKKIKPEQIDLEEAVVAKGGKKGGPKANPHRPSAAAKAVKKATKEALAPAAAPAPAKAAPAPEKRKVRVLAPAWNGWPQIERYTFYIDHAENGTFLAYLKFGAKYSARKFIEAVADGKPLELLGDKSILAGRCIFRYPDTDICVEVFNHKYSPDEAEWSLPPPYDGYAARLAGKSLERLAVAATPEAVGKVLKAERREASATAKPRAAAVPVTGRIKLVTKGNPCKAGTKSHSIFACFEDGLTVADFVKRGQPGWDMKGAVRYFAERGNIKVEEN